MTILKKLLKKPQGIIGILIVATLIFTALFAPVLAPNNPLKENLRNKYMPFEKDYPLGGDHLGRCELSRLIYGARYSVGMSVPSVLIVSALGLIVGLWSTHRGGYVEKVTTVLCNIFMALPALIIAAAIVGIAGKSMVNSMLALMLSTFAWYVRMVRSYTLIELNKNYITAAKIAGCKESQIVFNHLLPNIIPQFAIYVSTGISSAILTLSAFSFVGLGLPAGTPEWGMMLNEARGGLYSHAELLLYPSLCIMIAALGFNLLGEVFRDISEEGS